MSKATLSFGGRITAAEVQQLAELLAADRCPPLTSDDQAIFVEWPRVDDEGKVPPDFYGSAIRNAAREGQPLIIAADADDHIDGLLLHPRGGLLLWLTDRADRLAWRIMAPSFFDRDFGRTDGYIQVGGHGAPDSVLGSLTTINGDGSVSIQVDSLDDEADEDALIAAARHGLAISRFFPPALTIEG